MSLHIYKMGLYVTHFQTFIACLLGRAVVKNQPVSAGDARDARSIPERGRSPGVGSGNLFQYSRLENTMDRGAWWATLSPWGHRVRHD